MESKKEPKYYLLFIRKYNGEDNYFMVDKKKSFESGIDKGSLIKIKGTNYYVEKNIYKEIEHMNISKQKYYLHRMQLKIKEGWARQVKRRRDD